ncbi:uncharacterized protein BXZ73DRAFT_74268 [Epithele typhae]|uniref:uncharacterized protein n=1 Tax=Epithele typhae TaxID=378194 RepID=UPI002008CFA7|nr:uncharacterized protein BXZ73DRAFT_74268 [Epithele typhae]KAH9943276.1 hypothetical protein BXZ73DRAFT_74268 [Epithele typhae]
MPAYSESSGRHVDARSTLYSSGTNLGLIPPATSSREMLLERPDVSVVWPLDQFMDQLKLRDEAGFSATFSEARVNHIFSMFNSIFVDGTGKPKEHVVEKDEKIDQAQAQDYAPHGNLCPEFFLGLSEHRADEGDPSGLKCDGYFAKREDKNSIVTGVPNWPYQWFTVEFKSRSNSNDPFQDDSEQPEASATSRRLVRGQLFSYTHLVFHNQHRRFLYMLLVMGSQFRALHWDPSGIIASSLTNYADTVDGTRTLLKVLYGLSMMSDTAADFDPTAIRLSPTSLGWKRMDFLGLPKSHDVVATEEVSPSPDPMRDRFPEHLYHPLSALAPDCEPFAPGDTFGDPTAAAPCENMDPSWGDCKGPSTFTYIRSMFEQSCQSDRLPRYAITVQNKFYLGSGSEIEFLHKFSKTKGIHNVPTLVAPRSIPDKPQQDEGQLSMDVPHTFQVEPSNQTGAGSRHMKHCRSVVVEVCQALPTFSSSQHLVDLVHCAYRAQWVCVLTAHKDAAEKCDTLHRDISSGNILIWPTGTWAYASLFLQKHLTRVTNIGDDSESFLHVLIHQSVRFVKHNWSEDDVREFCFRYFDSYAGTSAAIGHSSFKEECIRAKALVHPTGGDALHFLMKDEAGNLVLHPLNALIHQLFVLFSARLLARDFDEQQARNNKMIKMARFQSRQSAL